MAWMNEPDYTGASAQEYVDRYTNRPEDAGSLEGIQTMLGNIGMAPGVGEPADLLNAILYGMQGKGGEAGLSALSMIPFLGGLVKPGRKAGKIFRGAGKSKDTPFASTDTYETGIPNVEDYYQGVPARSGGEGYFKSLLDDLFESFKGKEF
jgi:hypothetical protein